MTTLQELAKEWIEIHKDLELSDWYIMAARCPFCLDARPHSDSLPCYDCRLFEWLGGTLGCGEFLLKSLKMMGIDANEGTQGNLAWAICEYLGNGGK